MNNNSNNNNNNNNKKKVLVGQRRNKLKPVRNWQTTCSDFEDGLGKLSLRLKILIYELHLP